MNEFFFIIEVVIWIKILIQCHLCSVFIYISDVSDFNTDCKNIHKRKFVVLCEFFVPMILLHLRNIVCLLEFLIIVRFFFTSSDWKTIFFISLYLIERGVDLLIWSFLLKNTFFSSLEIVIYCITKLFVHQRFFQMKNKLFLLPGFYHP